MTVDNRYTRYRDLIPCDKLKALGVTIIGVGAIGRQVAMQLAVMGVGKLDLWDYDVVGEENLGTQGYRPDQLGKLKVDATAEDVSLINPNTQCILHNSKFGTAHSTEKVVAMCVDSIRTRKQFFLAKGLGVPLLVDGRMSAETVRVLSSRYGSGEYKNTFFSSGESFAGSCTAKSTFYSASAAASLMISEITKWLRDLPLGEDILLDLVSYDMVVNAGAPA